jgi:hypothetical protein
MCAVVRLRALMARQAARIITNPPIVLRDCSTGISGPNARTYCFPSPSCPDFYPCLLLPALRFMVQFPTIFLLAVPLSIRSGNAKPPSSLCLPSFFFHPVFAYVALFCMMSFAVRPQGTGAPRCSSPPPPSSLLCKASQVSSSSSSCVPFS